MPCFMGHFVSIRPPLHTFVPNDAINQTLELVASISFNRSARSNRQAVCADQTLGINVWCPLVRGHSRLGCGLGEGNKSVVFNDEPIDYIETDNIYEEVEHHSLDCVWCCCVEGDLSRSRVPDGFYEPMFAVCGWVGRLGQV